MSGQEVLSLVIGVLTGLVSSTAFVLALFIGFCVVVGLTKLKRTAGGGVAVVKSLEETVSGQPMRYLPPTAPRGPADQLKTPELVEAASRK